MNEFIDIKDILEQDEIILSYTGPINQKLIEGLSLVLNEFLKLNNISMSISLKIFAVFIEQTQNILYYSKNRGITLLGKKRDGSFFIFSGNETNRLQKERLEKKLEKVLTMNKDELKKAYKEARRTESDESSAGAGLGFFEMAKKSSKPIEYNFKKLAEDKYLFTLNVVI